MNSKISVLYVEDDMMIIDFIKRLFIRYKEFNVMYAQNGQEGLELYENNKFDLVITDMIMPIMNGFKLIEEIKKISPTQLFMLVTGLDNKEDLIKAINLRVNYFIEKPLNIKKFKSTLDEISNIIKQKQENELSKLTLEGYKLAIDNNSIVSKTDSKGIITYVNDNFCKISKYTKEELIGKSHKIVEHPNTDKETLKAIWTVISSNRQWQGKIKHMAKNKDTYVVDTLIMPIINTNNKIIEYVFMGHDITQLEENQERLKIELEEATQEIEDTQKEVVFTMGAIGETRSKETGLHVKRVAEYSALLAKLYGLDEHIIELIRMASPMHDIGKVGIPDNILNKPGRLTKEEFEVMKSHSIIGYDMLKHSTREIMKTSAIIALEHHERWDGKGYPNGSSGEDIHIYGRITAICDVFDALGSDRCYKKAWDLEKILKLFQIEKGKHFDPILMELFLDNLDDFIKIRDTYVDKFEA
ncbi:MAG: response regulator [Campylobacterota bacterium]|nr:response regulator [Campylobacterota bacterium]